MSQYSVRRAVWFWVHAAVAWDARTLLSLPKNPIKECKTPQGIRRNLGRISCRMPGYPAGCPKFEEILLRMPRHQPRWCVCSGKNAHLGCRGKLYGCGVEVCCACGRVRGGVWSPRYTPGKKLIRITLRISSFSTLDKSLTGHCRGLRFGPLTGIVHDSL